MKNDKIALLIGAPSTGKTSVLKELNRRGYEVFEEISRDITLQARENGIEHLFKNEPLTFSEKLLQGRIQQFIQAQSNKNSWSIIDRGLPDITAYLDMVQQPYPKIFEEANHMYIYNKVFWFPLWADIYKMDSERYEDFNTALHIENHLLKAYKTYNYNIIEVPKSNIEARLNFIISHLSDG